MAISTTITQYIENIDITYPIAGQDNNSQGFRSNFNNIQAALTATYAIVANQEDEIAALGLQLGTISTQNIRADIVTGTNIVQALNELIIGTTNVVTTGDNYYTVVTMAGAGAGGVKAAGDVALLHNTVVHNVTEQNPDHSTLIMDSVQGILVGATFSITDKSSASHSSAVSNVDNVANTITINPAINALLLNAGDPGIPTTFNNPFPAGQYDIQTQLSNLSVSSSNSTSALQIIANNTGTRLHNIDSAIAGLGTMSSQNSNNVSITGGTINSLTVTSLGSNAYNTKYIQGSQPSGGVNGDIWYQI